MKVNIQYGIAAKNGFATVVQTETIDCNCNDSEDMYAMVDLWATAKRKELNITNWHDLIVFAVKVQDANEDTYEQAS
jgi:hypothetical protein